MDIFIPIIICFVLFVFFSLCGMCCKRRRDQGAVIATPVVITATQHHVGPYPVTQVGGTTMSPPVGSGVVVQQHTGGTGVYPMPSYNASQPTAYQSQPSYPVQQQPIHQMPMPVPMQMQMPMPMPMPGGTAAPPMVNPPSYNEVVSEHYGKQAAYNPHFTGQ
ncbi:uncharacterized protein LOC131437084 [Malaya genurostris]|uniref:uncharacterized protein LOC131437084 n=1 Tax=Malaya genurostris TaxID=325434 RepID=UPI0026F3C9A0|nr:uncharacterized protein LOC131437084 [Malaya genurostris]